MENGKQKPQLYVIIFITGFLLFLSPLSEIANNVLLIAGIPLAFFYIFVAWLTVILLLFVASRKNDQTE